MKKIYITSLSLFIILSGCTNKELYETIQDDRLRECRQKAKTYDQSQQCDEMYGVSYEKYKKVTQ